MSDWPIDWRGVVGEAVRRRKREGLSQRALADLAGVSAPTVNAFERGDINLRLAGVVAILETLGLFVHAGSTDAQERFIYAARLRWEELVAPLTSEDSGRQALGHSEQAYALEGVTPPSTVARLREILADIPKSSGWSPFWVPTREGLRPYVEDGMLECWLGRPETERMFNDPAHSDFWRVSREGMAYLHRGYSEDGPSNLEPGTIFDISLPIWRTAELLLHAISLARALDGGGDTRIKFRARYSGLEGRELVSWSKPRNRPTFERLHRARSSHVDLAIDVALRDAEQGLDALVHQLLIPLYERFDGYVLSSDLVSSEIAELRRQAGLTATYS
ncbi:helix-turn-helix domain-containing protein [Sphingobium sp. BHU LFT2]|uniref:helix-turn-helix domain-containing protein n=1 Tax=Sphingobium sp. BHU LFT2 TaxID=2807634 RepID=UPI001BEC57E5|nr:helix-turn-helix domain-containing protein [Sphingobium sp. BHU LFT2]MBT2246890.1 helix-turn-helix domain-containing protein [Sphingobium sp. BHU LFT2]